MYFSVREGSLFKKNYVILLSVEILSAFSASRILRARGQVCMYFIREVLLSKVILGAMMHIPMVF